MKKRLVLLVCALLTCKTLLAQNAIGEVFSSDANVRGSVLLSGNGTRVLSGSQVTAGDGVALLKLERGGQVRICPKTNLSLSMNPGGKSLVLAMNTGAVELDYSLRSAVDSVITPDFRLQLISPGTFHFAISVAASGDTCLHSLPGNESSVFLAEMMGTESYQLSPGKSVLFKDGKIAGATEAPAVCGCPETKVDEPVTLPSTLPEQTLMLQGKSAEGQVAIPAETAPKASPEAVAIPAVTAKAGAVEEAGGAQHLEVEGSFVYHGNQAVQDVYSSVARLSLSRDNSQLALALLPKVSGPVQKSAPPAKKPGVLRRFGSFLGRAFAR